MHLTEQMLVATSPAAVVLRERIIERAPKKRKAKLRMRDSV